MLQQANFIPSTTNDIGSSSNKITSYRKIHLGHPLNESNTSNIGNSNILKTILSCSGRNIKFSNCWLIDSFSHCWLIDSGHNNHICPSLQVFESLYRIKHINVNLPSGNSVQVSYTCSVQISLFLYITNVLYSNEFKLNLIYVSKLYQSLNLSVKFTYNHCYFQDIKSLKMISFDNQVNGLYKLMMNIIKIWMTPSHAYTKFKLLHFDILGPIATQFVHGHK